MSSRQRTRGGSKFPTPWSDWTWNAVWKCEYRYRQVAANGNDNDIQYEYRDPKVPRNQGLETINESSTAQNPYNSEPYTPDHYTFNVENTTQRHVDKTTEQNVDDVAQELGGLGLEEGEKSSSTTGRPTSSGKSQSYYPQQTSPKGVPPRPIFTSNPSVKTDLDPDFKVHQSWEFKFGRVFKVLWTEPAGTTGTVITGVVKKAKHGEYAYHSIRRFVIVDPREGHSICLPILTYGGQGTLKRGVHASDHAVIYTGKAPSMDRKEKITKTPIRMEPTHARHKLDNASRINYAKLYTVEHNVKVHFIGEIARKHEQQVVTDYNATHRPLPDRPYYAGTSDDNAFGHAQGPEPGYSAPGASQSWPAATTASPTYYKPSTYQVPYASQPQSYPTTSTQYDVRATYGSYKGYPTQPYTPSAQNTHSEEPYQPGGSQYTEEPPAGGGPSNAGDILETIPPTGTIEDPPATEDSTPHYEEDLYRADYN